MKLCMANEDTINNVMEMTKVNKHIILGVTGEALKLEKKFF